MHRLEIGEQVQHVGLTHRIYAYATDDIVWLSCGRRIDVTQPRRRPSKKPLTCLRCIGQTQRHPWMT